MWNHSLTRFLLIGVINTIVGLSTTYLLLNLFGISYWISTFAGNCTGGVTSYFLNRSFTFRNSASVGTSWWKFILVLLASYAVSYSLGLQITRWVLALFTDNTAWIENVAVLVGSVLYTLTSYLGHKWFTFRESKSDSTKKHPGA
ncbi:polysaccharide biosynthesis protein GtrA [Tumebacillus flagellatus]|uniref:Polysaccharide biosynthesis protein GtrA n=1 Tax=Tumebacillus flagellatus TaxID=1157490 RepID=A0A074LMF8_9BACL|nr:polysaccharide biosynthesis protein GtrA [Tumebacillus flagellatus]